MWSDGSWPGTTRLWVRVTKAARRASWTSWWSWRSVVTIATLSSPQRTTSSWTKQNFYRSVWFLSYITISFLINHVALAISSWPWYPSLIANKFYLGGHSKCFSVLLYLGVCWDIGKEKVTLTETFVTTNLLDLVYSSSIPNKHSWVNIILTLLLEKGRLEMFCPHFSCTAIDPEQREVSSVGQTAGTVERARPQSSHLLPDGTDVGYPGWLSEEQAVPLSGSCTLFSHDV